LPVDPGDLILVLGIVLESIGSSKLVEGLGLVI